MFKRRRKKYNMSKQAANDTLMNVLAACNIETDNINFDLLLLKSMAQTNLIDSCKWIAIGALFLILIAPAALVNSDLKVSNSGIAHDRIIIEDHSLYEDHFVLKLSGDTIDYDSVYAKDSKGAVVFPTTIDEAKGLVTFPYKGEWLIIYISDEQGHTLNATLSGGVGVE